MAVLAHDHHSSELAGHRTEAAPVVAGLPVAHWQRRYLDMMLLCITGMLPQDVWHEPFKAELAAAGKERYESCISMIGYPRLLQCEKALRDLEARGIDGDVLEAGCWRGGACLYMKAVLNVLGNTTRTMWLADSFNVFPAAEAQYPADADNELHKKWKGFSTVSFVQTMFHGYGLADARVKILSGYFKDTLHTAPIRKLALLRLDGDLYASTMQTLEALYDKVSVGGYIVVDDYATHPAARQATDDFRSLRSIRTPLRMIDWAAHYWIKEAA